MPAIPFSCDRDLSFREMSAWACLCSIVGVYVPYFIYVYRIFETEPWRGGLMMGRVLEPMTIAIVVQAILNAAIHIVISIMRRPGRKDERDVGIEARSFRYAYRVLAVLLLALVMLVPCCVAERSGHITAFPFVIQLVWLSFVGAEATKYFVRAIGYRRGY